jgi:cell division protein ZapA
MGQVTVTISGKAYRMACADGEEPHLEALAALYDGKIEELRASVGEIGDMRLHVMAAIVVADELSETRKKIAALEARLDALTGDAGTAGARADALEMRTSEALKLAAERIERVSKLLRSPQAQG